MKILFLLSRFPCPPVAGAPWQALNLIKYLARDHECHILAFADRADENPLTEFARCVPNARVLGVFPYRGKFVARVLKRAVDVRAGILGALPPAWAGVVRGLSYVWRFGIAGRTGRWPFRDCWDEGFARAVRAAANSGGYDVVHVESIMLAGYRDYCANLPAVMCPYDAVAGRTEAHIRTTEGLERATWRLCAWALRSYERRAYRGFGAVCVVSQGERGRLVAANGAPDAEVIAISVDDAFFESADSSGGSGPPGRVRDIFMPTSWKFADDTSAETLLEFLRDGFQELRRAHPVRAIVSYGRMAPSVVEALRAIPGVVAAGWVDDYVSAMRNADAIVFTELGDTGIKNRVVQAMALGKPVIASSGAASGIEAADGVHLWIGNHPSDMTRAIDGLLRNPELARRTGAAARAFARKHFSMDIIGPCWERLYARTISEGRP